MCYTTNILLSRSAKSCWGDKKFKEVFCVDSSVDMNNLALALIQGGVWPNQENDCNSIEEKNKEDSSTLKGLYFRQFMPTSSAVSNFFHVWIELENFIKLISVQCVVEI